MKAWNIDADNIDGKETIAQHSVVVTEEVQEFLLPRGRGNKFFLVGAKGIGKTLFLKILSKENRSVGITCIPQSQLVEKITIESDVVLKDIASYGGTAYWRHVWKMTFYLSICRRLDYQLPKEVENVLGSARTVNDIMNNVLNNYSLFFHKYNDVFIKHINPLISRTTTPVAIFVDSLDQNLGLIIKSDRYLLDDEGRHIPEKTLRRVLTDFWTAPQLGLMHAVHEICTQFSHIKIYSTVRQEAYEALRSDTRMQMAEYVAEIQYTKAELLTIFEQNIANTAIDKLVDPKADNPTKKFLGFDSLPHSFVPGRMETAFDFIYRHTFTRPREIILIGKHLASMNPVLRSVENVRETVNRISHSKVFEQFKAEVIPFFDEGRLKDFFKPLASNVFSKDEALKVQESQLRYYIKVGLIGSTRSNHTKGTYTQKFREAHRFGHVARDIPEADYFFSHPALDELVINHLGKTYNKGNIIGYDYPFAPGKRSTIRKAESRVVHFGIGNFGTGFVLPYLIRTGASIALVNRPSARFEHLQDARVSQVLFTDTNQTRSAFVLLNNSTPQAKVKETLKHWIQGRTRQIMIVRDDDQLLKKVIEEASFATTAVKTVEGATWVADKLLSARLKRKTGVYCFENAKDVPNTIRELLSSKREFHVKQVLGDRVCADQHVRVDGSLAHVVTTAENYSKLVVMESKPPSLFATKGMQRNPDITIVKQAKEFDYFVKRKYYLFNCVHAMLSCYCYSYLADKIIQKTQWEQQYIDILKDVPAVTEDIELVCSGQVLMLLCKIDKPTLAQVFGEINHRIAFEDLFKYACDNLDRMGSNRDRLIRVMPLPKYAERYASRIKELIEFFGNERNIAACLDLGVYKDSEPIEDIVEAVKRLRIEAAKVALT